MSSLFKRKMRRILIISHCARQNKPACCRRHLRESCIAALIQHSLQFPMLRLAIYARWACAASIPTKRRKSHSFVPARFK